MLSVIIPGITCVVLTLAGAGTVGGRGWGAPREGPVVLPAVAGGQGGQGVHPVLLPLEHLLVPD